MTETKIAPAEAKSREQREARVATNKKLIDKTTRVKAKGIGKVVNIKIAQRSGRPLQRKSCNSTINRGRCRDGQAGVR